MDAMLQKHCARFIYVIPDGLRELMNDISREVLRSQPEDVYTFIADYLDALMITRENARVAARLVESLTEMATTTAMFLEETGMPRDDVDNIVAAIQTTFRKSIDSEEIEEPEESMVVSGVLTDLQIRPDQVEVAAAVIQNAYRRFKERKEREKELLAGMVDWRVAARSAIRLYRKTGVTNEEANRAATLIKAAYKGYYTRKVMKKATEARYNTPELHLGISEYVEEDEYVEDTEMNTEDDVHSEGKAKSVTIDYHTVIPHVAFDTTPDAEQPETMEKKVSTVSSVARYSLKCLFDSVLDKVKDSISEEVGETDVGIKTSPVEPHEEKSDNASEEDNKETDTGDKAGEMH